VSHCFKVQNKPFTDGKIIRELKDSRILQGKGWLILNNRDMIFTTKSTLPTPA